MGLLDRFRKPPTTDAKPLWSPGTQWPPPAPAASPAPPAAASPPPPPPTITARFTGTEVLEVVGESYRQDNLWKIVGSRPSSRRVSQEAIATLLAEHDNVHDANAVGVWIQGLLVGYLSRYDAARYRPVVLRLAEQGPVTVTARIIGGGYDGDAILGVFLDHDPTAFGLTPGGNDPASIRTGLSEAMWTDRRDDSYDLGWLRTLPEDRTRAIAELRKLLESERDPIDRHYMFLELEARLYALRDAFADALDQYDAACRAHDAEMGVLAPALLAKFTVMPLLDTYRQQAIRQQKAKAWEQMAWWAERGLELYGDQAANSDWVHDLRKKAATARAKLQG